MKKLTGFLLAILAFAVVSISFTSCGEPEESDDPNVPNVPEETVAGVYNPRKKISKIYVQKEGEQEYLLQDWEWEGNKLGFITYYEEGRFKAKNEFIYEGDRLVKVVGEGQLGYHTEYFYIGKKFEKINYYKPTGDISAECRFLYQGDKITNVIVNRYNSYGVGKDAISVIEKSLIGAEKLVNQVDTFTHFFDFLYEGENLISISQPSGPFFTLEGYDKCFNVMYNFFPFATVLYAPFPFSVIDTDLDVFLFSKNNPRKVTYEFYQAITTYTYTYDDHYPITIQSNMVVGDRHEETIYRILYQ